MASHDGSRGVPVTLLSGFLGSGKTSVLKHVLGQMEGTTWSTQGVAVIVNDMAAINMDAEILRRSRVRCVDDDEHGRRNTSAVGDMITLENGCICCTLRGSLLRAIRELALTDHVEYIVIESTGIAEPMQVAETFYVTSEALELVEAGRFEDVEGDQVPTLTNVAYLDTCVTVVDASTVWQEIFDQRQLSAKESTPTDEDESISKLLIEQLEFANVIVINKIDLVAEEEVVHLIGLIANVNPTARVLRTSYGKVDPGDIMQTNLFSFQRAISSPGWLTSLRESHVPETEEYGIRSFIYSKTRPFHPFRFYSLVTQNFLLGPQASQAISQQLPSGPFQGLIRSKGFIWLAGRDRVMVMLSSSGPIIDIEPEDYWLCEYPIHEQAGFSPCIKNLIAQEHGDRRQEIVVIGTSDLDINALTTALDRCLVTDQEWRNVFFDDPFPIWRDYEPEECRF